MINKRKYKEIESDGPNEPLKRGEKRQKIMKVKTQVAMLPRWLRKILKKVQNPKSGYTNRK